MTECQSGGNIVIAWEESFEFVIIDGTTYKTIHGPGQLYNPAAETGNTCVSATADEANHAILTWMNSDLLYRHSLYYALVDGNGNVLTEPMIFHTSQAIGPGIVSNCGGYGNTSYKSSH